MKPTGPEEISLTQEQYLRLENARLKQTNAELLRYSAELEMRLVTCPLIEQYAEDYHVDWIRKVLIRE